MERLTEKYEDEDGRKRYIHKIGECSLVDCYNKLGGLENIEDELGVSLVVLFKALKKGIWSTIKLNRLHKENQIYQFKNVSLKLFEEGWGLVDLRQSFGENLTGTLVLLKHYGDTWALTREELENAKD